MDSAQFAQLISLLHALGIVAVTILAWLQVVTAIGVLMLIGIYWRVGSTS